VIEFLQSRVKFRLGDVGFEPAGVSELPRDETQVQVPFPADIGREPTTANRMGRW
jgi:hypothetical protein